MNINHLHDKDIRRQASIDNLIRLALAEDIGSGDITTDAIVSQNVKGEAYVVAKEDMILSGIGVFKKVFQNVSGKWSVVSLEIRPLTIFRNSSILPFNLSNPFEDR